MQSNSLNEDKPAALLVFLINSRGGKGSGQKVLQMLKDFDNCVALNILDFAGENRPDAEKRLQEAFASDQRVRFVLAGGDGTVTWGFQILESLSINAPVAIMALGTANEMGRCIGWGKRFKSKNLGRFVEGVRTRPVVPMDLWRVEYDVGDEVPRENERWPTLMGGFLSFGLFLLFDLWNKLLQIIAMIYQTLKHILVDKF